MKANLSRSGVLERLGRRQETEAEGRDTTVAGTPTVDE